MGVTGVIRYEYKRSSNSNNDDGSNIRKHIGDVRNINKNNNYS